ncbi:MAG: radical SAM protein, partial [bacterium]
IGLIEVNGQCELACPDCYTGRQAVSDLTLADIGRMMDFLQTAEEGRAEILQLSGGEPTLHPAILDILALAKTKRFKYILLNSNGLRMAEDDTFIERLASFLPQFEVYLQYDGREPGGHHALRGRDLRAVKEQAIRKLTAAGIPVTLVATIRKGANDHEIGSILRHAMSIPGIRGVNYQPLAYYGWGDVRDRHDRITMTGVLERLERQTEGEYRLTDFVPLPCNVERVALTYCYRDGERFVPITRRFDVREHLPMITNTLAFDADDYLAKAVSGSALCDCMTRFLSVLRPFIPSGYERLNESEKAGYFNRNLFRISVSSFVDPYNFDLRSMRRECVHVITRDLRRIPFSAYNMFHRMP